MVRTEPAAQAVAHGPHHAARTPHAGHAVARLTARLIRRGATLMAFGVALYVAVEVFTYLRTYPDAASRSRLAMFQDNPASRMLQGIPHGVDTPGGFVVWDGGWLLAAIAGIWAILTTGRLLRGEEEAERAELMLAAPIRASRALVAQFLVLGAASLLIGVALTAVLVVAGTGAVGSVLFGLAMAGFTATFVGVAAVAAQLFEVRRRAVGVASSLFGVLFLIRMLANSADSRGWLRWLSPFGWLDELRPYAAPRWIALVPLLAAPVLLGAAAVALRSRRDTGGAILPETDRRAARLRLLGSPTAFAWHSARGVFTGWLIGTAAYTFMIGSMVKAVTDFVLDDPNYRRVLAAFGMDMSRLTEGFVGMMGVLTGLLFVLYACWRIGAARTEEAAGRAEHILTRPVPRWRWLGGHTLVTLVTATVLTVAGGLATWAGAAVTGADVGIGDALASALNTLPLIVVFTGLAVLAYGTLPRLTTGLSVTAAVVAYLVEFIGPALKWPAWALDLSPFHHVAYVPAEPFAPISAAVLTVIGLCAALLGGALFERRDLAGD